uniref:hypothetical protein n=1 Tax=Oscillibacter sp. CU971 TaxID=2780102 RepID=UPI00195C58BD
AIQTFELDKIVEMQLFERMKTILESEKALVPVEDSKKVNDLKIKMVEVQQRIDALTESIASLSVKVIAEVNKKIEQEIEKKDSLAAELEEALREQRSKNYSQYNIEEYINNWEDYDTEEKKRVARIFIDKVIVKDGDIQVIMK